jgi:hypothetical protein
MATQVKIPGAGSSAKVRNPLAVVALSIVTFGVYFFFWWYFVNRELADFGKAQGTEECGTSPVKSLLAVSIGAFVVIPTLISYFKGFKRVNAANRLAGSGAEFDAGLGLLIWILISPIAIYIFQMNMNKLWESAAEDSA